MAGKYFRAIVSSHLDACTSLAKFLIREVGWTLVEKVYDDNFRVTVVLSSPGEPGALNSNTRYICLDAKTGHISFYTYETYTNFTTHTGRVYSAINGKIPVAVRDTIISTANLERLIVSSVNASDANAMGYVGRINSYYLEADLPYPNAIRGCTYHPNGIYASDKSKQGIYMINNAGALDSFHSIQMQNDVHYDFNPYLRGSNLFLNTIPIYCDTVGSEEVVGEFMGLFSCRKFGVALGTFVNFGDDIYVCISEFSDNKSFLLAGPVAQITPPEDVPDIDWFTSI